MINPKEFNINEFTPVKATVGAIIEENRKVFLTKRSHTMEKESGKWCIPGGHIEISETAEEALKREVKEETNLSLRNIKFLGYQDEYLPKLKVHAINLIFSAGPYGKESLSNEVSEEKWFTKEETQKLDLAFKDKEIIKRFFNPK
ncbi:MAG: NUDIX hydrolase [archaeon]